MVVMRNFVGRIFLSLLLPAFIHAAQETHKYEVESGVVFYDIQGAAQLTEETNLSVSGTGKLRFKDWGEVLLKEDNAEALTTGALHHRQQLKKLIHIEHEKVITVDYKNEQLLESKRSLLTMNPRNATHGLVQEGEERVAGFLCQVWKDKNSQKCLYKGVVLKEESHTMGVSYSRVARTARFDINASEEACHLPDYPLQDIGLFKDNPKTKNNQKTEQLCNIINKGTLPKETEKQKFSTLDIESETRQKFINHIGKEIFTSQKELLPQELNVLKEMRVCLYKATSSLEAKRCFKTLKTLKESQGVEMEIDVSDWDDKGRVRILDDIEDDIISFQSRMPCVNRAKNITDLSSCMK